LNEDCFLQVPNNAAGNKTHINIAVINGLYFPSANTYSGDDDDKNAIPDSKYSQSCYYAYFVNVNRLYRDWRTAERRLQNAKFLKIVLATTRFQRQVSRQNFL